MAASDSKQILLLELYLLCVAVAAFANQGEVTQQPEYTDLDYSTAPEEHKQPGMRGAASQMYSSGAVRKEQGGRGQQNNPHNARNPDKHKLPNNFNPMPIPVFTPLFPKNPYYNGIGLPVPLPVPGEGNQYDPTQRNTFRSNIATGPGINSKGVMVFPQFGFPPHRSGRVDGQKNANLQEEDEEPDPVSPDQAIYSGKFDPCGSGYCLEGEFICTGTCTCIPGAYRCDGKFDCEARDDELGCGEIGNEDVVCFENSVRCPRSGKCILKAFLCDGDDDCGDFSDETHCDGKNCTENQFECNNGLCVQKTWLCDGENDCKDYSDEINCTKRTSCTGNEFLCSDGNCISLSWKCDSEPDCADGSDEASCPQEPRVCTENEFECAYPRCVRKEFKCDGDDDCGDWSDEENCPQVPSSCGPTEFKCNGGKCIPERWKCDEEIDCDGSEDEEGCALKKPRTCGPDEFTCNNGNCVLKTWMCDNVQDCPKGEDEEDCQQTCEEAQFNCANNRATNETLTVPVNRPSRPYINCIGQKHVCDGKKDCPKGEDEKNCPSKNKCEVGTKCHQICVTLSNGQNACACKPGFVLANDGYSCNDVDECQFEADPVCSQTCNNTIGSFTCSCMRGYVLRPDARTCKAVGDPPTLLFANRVDIRQVSLNNLKYKSILKGLHNAIALDYHYSQGWIFWSDLSMDVIMRSRLNGTEKGEVIRWGLESPGGVAIDWIHNLLYWTDSGTRRVEVTTLDGSYRSVVASNDLDKPRAIVAHPGEAFIFWTDWGPKPKIERAEMDGSNRKSIITESVFWPNGLTVDYAMDRIYWADAKHHVIESAMYDGSDRRKVITKGLPHPFAITLFEDAVYWTDWHTKSIATANKDTGTGYKVVHSGLHFPMDIHSFHPQRQPDFSNHCGLNNGGCSHLCLPNKSGYKCVCPVGLQLHRDEKSCSATPEKLLIFARKKDIRLRLLDKEREVDNIDMVIPLDSVQSAAALAFDYDAGTIYWTDTEAGAISRSYLNGSEQQVVVNSNLANPAGLALDWVTKKLYWTDAVTNRIEVSNLNGSMRALLIWEGLDQPRDIALNPAGGYMYWTSWGTMAKIERSGMDGTVRKVIVQENLTWPNGLVVDHDKRRIYWVDGGTKAIEYANLDGSGRTALHSTELKRPFGLAMYKNSIYWTDWWTASIHKADKADGANAVVLRDGVSGLMDISTFQADRGQLVPSLCLVDNGGCSHHCLLAPSPAGYSCACPIGIKLLEDGKTCANGPTNSLIFAHRLDVRQISLDVPYTVDVVLPLPPMKNTVAVDVDRVTGFIYWSDTAEDMIERSFPDGMVVEAIVIDGLETADGIVVDSTGRKLYWTDAGRNSIEVSELDGSDRKVLIWTGLDSPRAITLHYHLGLMYWSDWGTKAKIEQADMDGRNRKTVISEDLIWPNGLAIDRPAGRLYWNDGKRKTIESSTLSGGDRKLVVKDVPHPYGLVIVGSHIYWTDWKTEAVHRADKDTGNNSQVIRGNLSGLMNIRSVQVENIAENACGNNNGGCSHLCLRTPKGFACACPTGILLQDDGKTCDLLPSAYLLFSTRNTLARVSLDTPELWDVTLPINNVHNAIAVDFHWKKQMIYYTDVHLDIIRGVNMRNLSDTKVLVSMNLTTPDGLAVDWLADNLYWTDTGRKVLEVARLDGTARKAIISQGLDEPRAVALFPKRGYLFWTDWGDKPKIERAMLDGSQRRVIVGADLGFPNGLALDFNMKSLFWADALKDRIEMSDLGGRNRVQLVPQATHPFGLTQFGDYIYWTDWYNKSVERANKSTGRDRMLIRMNLDGVMEIRAVASSKQTGQTPCVNDNGGCSHLCLFRQDDYMCSCPDESDGRPCIERVVTFNSIKKEDDNDQARSGLDSLFGDTNLDEPPPVTDTFSKQILISILTVICVLIALSVASTILLLLHRRRKKQKKYFYANGKNVLTFSNPNYTASSGEAAAAAADKKPFLWKKLKYDRSQERVYGVQDDKPEGVGLMDRGGSSPPTPPKRLDSINLK